MFLRPNHVKALSNSITTRTLCSNLTLLAGLRKSRSGAQNAHICHFPPVQLFSTRCVFIPLRDTGQYLGDIFGCHNWREGRRTLLNIIRCRRQPLTAQRIIWSKCQSCPVWEIPPPWHQTLGCSLNMPDFYHTLLSLNICCFLSLECPALFLGSRNDHLSFRIQLRMSPPLCCPFRIPPDRDVVRLSFRSFWYILP